MKNPKRLIQVAAGRAPADLVLKNANVVHVFTGEILPGDVAIVDGTIAGVGSYSGAQEIDCTGRFVCPGFIDAHLHIESSMVLPPQLVRAVLPSGTTTLIADPHEIVNVCGRDGMRFMLQQSAGLPCNIFYMLPSSVPATLFETAGGSFTAADIASFTGNEQVLGLGEVMCFPDVISGEGAIFEKFSAAGSAILDGHAPGLSGKDLAAYAAANIATEHECTTFAEAAEKARAGLAILVREGSAAHNLAAIIQGLVQTGIPTNRFLFCTDDKHLDDIYRDGHIRWNIKLAIELGLDPVAAIRMASWNTAQVYRLPHLGAIAPGYRADLVLLRNLRQVEVDMVFKDGIPAKECLEQIDRRPPPSPDSPIFHTVHIPPVSAADFSLPVSGPAHVIELVPFQLTTRHLVEEIPATDGFFQPNAQYTKLCVIERHGKNGNIAVAPLKGYGLTGGAIATTVAHDSHNIIAAGDSDADIALAVNRLRDIGGGYVLVQNGAIAGEVPLAAAGLMSTQPAETVQRATGDIIAKATAMGTPYYVDPFTTLSFLALPVIPSLRLTDQGLFDVDQFQIIPRTP